MQRGRKQGLWVGRRVPEVDEHGAPILYSRYTSIEDVLQGSGGADAGKQQRANGADAGSKKGKRAAAQQEPDSDSGSDSEPGGEPEASSEPSGSCSSDEEEAPPQPKGKQDRKKQRTQEQQERRQQRQQQRQEKQKQKQAQAAAAGSGSDSGSDDDDAGGGGAAKALEAEAAAGNAAQAQQIRSVLGFEGASAKPAGGFAFSFDAQVAAQVEAETDAKLARLHAIDSADKDGYIPRRVFVGGMPYSYSREQIEEYWSWCGEIEGLDMLTFPDSGRFRGIAFITFKSQEGYEAALACNGEQVDGQTLKVDKCKAAAAAPKRGGAAPAAPAAAPAAPAPAPAPKAAAPSPGANRGGAAGGSGRAAKTPGYNVAYVGNIAFEVTPDELREVFGGCGVKLVRLHTDQASGRSKGYAHVHFEDEAGLDRAMELDGHIIHGRGIRVSYGQPKK